MITLPVANRFPVSRSAWIYPVLLAVAIFAASSRSQLAGPQIEGSDKVVHFAVYGLLATLTVRLGRGWRTVVVSLLLVSAFGISDEWHQSFTPGRSVEFADWVADTLGAAFAVTLYTRWPRYRAVLEISLTRQRRVEKPAEVTSVSGL